VAFNVKCYRYILMLALAVVGSAVLAGAELLLTDGQILEGVNVRRDGEVYLVKLEAGGVLTIPVALVKEVRLGAEPAPPPKPARPAPTGFRSDGPETLAGAPVTPPKTSEQTAVFGDPAKFQGGIRNPDWHPSSDWDNDPTKNNNWAPSRWAGDIVESKWAPESAFDANKDVLASGKSTFSDSIVDNSWQPEDGFKQKDAWGN
jgi:hypothetical protein